MPESSPLKGETIIFTGTPKSLEVFDLVREYGGNPYSMPLIQVNEIEAATDESILKRCADFDWLIFTSQSAVKAFHSKMNRFTMTFQDIPSKIAAVGTQTAAALEKIGFTVEFIPSIFSADVFVKQFKPTEDSKLRVLFLKGNLAGSIIREELPFHVEEWTVYETGAKSDSVNSIIELLQMNGSNTVLFASPSAVRVFEKGVVPVIGWEGYTIGAIGHVTEKALLEAGAKVDVKPEIYTLKELVKALARRKEEIQ
ncbi:uroporphyrinogen-III synthase [Sporosarcina sp. ACRSL]|uniref:uroporphyrinogen-III synthase n=1 Tax=Sporosarcina sp. ACRSL TaxID=2918215 RepID=UPI001EF5EF79|nr:uroporphyrinogen-III synthase [Sporosarcina sp. ACRSL]MCG7344987.1 uroporphyrinogen-III synthase [Sporosarcina sp. ACRSL]